MSNEVEVSRLLHQMRAMAAQAQGQQPDSTNAVGGSDFSAMLKQSIDKVNEFQDQSGKLQEAFEQGDPQVNLAEVMVAVQKANVSFQAMTEVRNKLVDAYKEIMRMQV